MKLEQPPSGSVQLVWPGLGNSESERSAAEIAFFRDLQTRFRAPGDFAQAYVIAHEVGHHVQKLTGTFQKMEEARGLIRDEMRAGALGIGSSLIYAPDTFSTTEELVDTDVVNWEGG